MFGRHLRTIAHELTVYQLPHVHLLNSQRYPAMPRVEMQEVAKWLLEAPHLAKNTSPFHWTYLDVPADGTIILTWQPLARMGTNFASDGFVWAQPEHIFKQDIGNGLVSMSDSSDAPDLNR
jgi:hypothetical protein